MNEVQGNDDLWIPREALFTRLIYWLHGEEAVYYAWLHTRMLQGLDDSDSDENLDIFYERPALPPLWYLGYVSVRHYPVAGLPLSAWEDELPAAEVGWRRMWALARLILRARFARP